MISGPEQKHALHRDAGVDNHVSPTRLPSQFVRKAIRICPFRPKHKHDENERLNQNSGDICHIVSGVFTPVLAKHSKSFSLIDCMSVGVDRMQRNFEPMRKQVESLEEK
jgi:hypothetical protein